jgi:FKBP-type peptidyl-prolyl cis-trans isomerase
MNLKLLLSIGLSSILLFGCNEMGKPAAKTALVTEKDNYSYALGASFGQQARALLIQRDSIDLDYAVFMQAFTERFEQDSAKLLMTDSALFAVLNDFSMKRQQEKVQKDSLAAEKNLQEQKAFLEKNKTEGGVITTASGLQYLVIIEGKGDLPKETDIVSVHYTGTLLDGTEFDSSIKRGAPAEFPLNAVIPGWTELLKVMKVGSKVKAWIPSDLAYGPRGRQVIPGNSLLVFEMELLGVKASEQAAAPAAAPAKPATVKKPAAAKPAPAPAAAPAAAQ